tara:strand:+ start:2060 stop:2797 length:738 start_codon:yes stop_codon:yes gene_type:complete
MANQQAIDTASELIANLVDKAKQELINDLYKAGTNVDNIPAFVDALLDLDLEGTLKTKLTNATSAYANAHRGVLESTVQFANIDPNTLTSFISLNEKVFDNAIINNIASHIRNEVVKGIQAGLTPDMILQNVTSSSISNSQMQTLVNTTLNSYSRTVTSAMMDIAPKNTLYHYIGPVDDKTRSKCLQMASAGRITKKELISSFSSEVLVEGGGFNCRHKWEVAGTQTSEFHLPKEASERLSSAGQ